MLRRHLLYPAELRSRKTPVYTRLTCRVIELRGMALHEYYCNSCKKPFEQLTSILGVEVGKCPFCNGKDTKRLISRFAVGGQGDQRESTLHGCHEYSGVDHDHSDHSHGDHED